MKNIFTVLPQARHWLMGLGLGLLAAGPALAQSQLPTRATTVYGLGYNVNTKATFIQPLNPANLNSNTPGGLFIVPGSNPTTYYQAAVVSQTGITSGQRLVGLDVRPSTGQFYALGYDYIKTTNNAQLYTLLLNAAGNGYDATPVGTVLTLDLQDPIKGPAGSTTTVGSGNTLDFSTLSPTLPQLYNITFDFNPRADRIRVNAPRSSSTTSSSGITYVLNPNNGTSSVGSAITGSSPNSVPYYVGTGAYTNSAFGVAGTTLYDISIANTNGNLVTQNTSTGALTQQASVTFATLMSNGTYSSYAPLNSPTIRLDLDVYYDRGSASAQKNIAYVLEARRNPNNNGYSSNLYTLNLTSGQATGQNIYGTSDAGGNASFIYDIATLPSGKVWIGKSTAAPTAWNDDANWFPTGAPNATDDVLIPGIGSFVAFGSGYTITTQPVVSTRGTSTTDPLTSQALSVTLSNGALLTTVNGGTLNVYGDFVNNDSQVDGNGDGVIALVGTTTHDISGNTQTNFWNLSVNTDGTTTTTSAAVAIRRSVAVTGTLAIGASQAFTLLSSGTTTTNNTAYVVNNGNGTITGIATVQRYISPTYNSGLGYRHYSSPVSKASGSVTSNTVADLSTANFTPVVNPAYNTATTPRQTTPYPTVFAYDQTRLATSNASYAVGDFDNGFFSPTALTDTLAPARGYTVNIQGTELVDFQGKLHSGNYSSGPLARGAQISAGYHLLGNPYPGAISYTTVYASSTGIVDALYVYKSNGQYTGSYSAYISNTNYGVNGGTDNVPLAQGFFVRAQPGGGSVNFTNAARTNAPPTALFQRTASTSATLALTLSGNGAANQTRIYFDPNATAGFDDRYDAFYLPASHGLDLASDVAPEALSINALPELKGTATVALRLHTRTAGTYTLAVDELNNLPAGYRAYLRDAATGTVTDLTATPSVSLALAPADAATGRYAVVFATSQPLATAPAALAALVAVYPSPAHGTATLVLPQALRGSSASTVQLLNTLGQVVLTRTLAAGATADTIELPLTAIAPGIYTVRATTAAGVVAKRLVVQ